METGPHQRWDHRVERLGLRAPGLWGSEQWRSPTVLFMPVLYTLLCVISLTSLVLCLSLSGFEIQEVGVHPTKGRPVPLAPSPVVRE